jgi:chorismate lyase/3-hydroxybenzoate synthase
VSGPDHHQAELPVDVMFLTAEQLQRTRGAKPARILGTVQFGLKEPVHAVAEPSLAIAMPQLGAGAVVETWISATPVTCGASGPIAYAQNEDVLFGAISVGGSPDEPGFEAEVGDLYRRIFELIEGRGYPHLLRAWNYFPRITSETQGLENYQRFCRGRAQAFQDHYAEFLGRLPSASAVGADGGGLGVYFIASRTPGRHRENPRQVSAYHYPPQYGPRSPSFARATLKRWNDEAILFVSGTASIVGHESRHVGDVGAQIEETLLNIEALIGSTGEEERAGFRGLGDLTHVKVYLRKASDLAPVRARLEGLLDPTTHAMYLRADICRRDLLVEIEGVARARCA